MPVRFPSAEPKQTAGPSHQERENAGMGEAAPSLFSLAKGGVMSAIDDKYAAPGGSQAPK